MVGWIANQQSSRLWGAASRVLPACFCLGVFICAVCVQHQVSAANPSHRSIFVAQH